MHFLLDFIGFFDYENCSTPVSRLSCKKRKTVDLYRKIAGFPFLLQAMMKPLQFLIQSHERTAGFLSLSQLRSSQAAQQFHPIDIKFARGGWFE